MKCAASPGGTVTYFIAGLPAVNMVGTVRPATQRPSVAPTQISVDEVTGARNMWT